MPTRMRIQERFGETVADLVMACSDAHEIPKPPWQARKENHVAEVAAAPPEVKLIVAADKLHNARSIRTDLHRHGDGVWGRFSGRRDGTVWYYRAMLDALDRDWHHPILAELREAVDALEG